MRLRTRVSLWSRVFIASCSALAVSGCSSTSFSQLEKSVSSAADKTGAAAESTQRLAEDMGRRPDGLVAKWEIAADKLIESSRSGDEVLEMLKSEDGLINSWKAAGDAIDRNSDSFEKTLVTIQAAASSLNDTVKAFNTHMAVHDQTTKEFKDQIQELAQATTKLQTSYDETYSKLMGFFGAATVQQQTTFKDMSGYYKDSVETVVNLQQFLLTGVGAAALAALTWYVGRKKGERIGRRRARRSLINSGGDGSAGIQSVPPISRKRDGQTLALDAERPGDRTSP